MSRDAEIECVPVRQCVQALSPRRVRQVGTLHRGNAHSKTFKVTKSSGQGRPAIMMSVGFVSNDVAMTATG